MPENQSNCVWIRTGGQSPRTLIDVKWAPGSGGWDYITLTPCVGSRAARGQFRKRLERAAQWIVDVDAASAERLKRGRPVSKRIPSEPRPFNVYSSESLPPSGVLIWPLLHEEPRLPLLPYQEVGVDFLLDHPRAILADDMGLGKTLQAIAAVCRLVHLGQIRQALIVCPRTLVRNWVNELEHWTPALAVLELRTDPDARLRSWRDSLGRSHILLAHYEELRAFPSELLRHRFPLIIADEAHRLRNTDAAVTMAVRSLKSDRFWALSGTPVERSPDDLVALMSLLEPKRFSSMDTSQPLASLRARARPYLLRRLKKEVLSDLPAAEEHTEVLTMTPAQRRDYRAVINGDVASAHTSDDFLAIYGRLRSLCDVAQDGKSSAKANRIVDIIEAIRPLREKVVCFSYLLEPLRLLEQRLQKRQVPCLLLTGEVGSEERARLLDKFRAAEGTVVLLASSRVAGEGLTLTEANHVIFFNEWWNPSANAQARDRVVRLGQRRLVHIYKFRMHGTLEDVLDSMHARKTAAAESLLDPKRLVEDRAVRRQLFDASQV